PGRSDWRGERLGGHLRLAAAEALPDRNRRGVLGSARRAPDRPGPRLRNAAVRRERSRAAGSLAGSLDVTATGFARVQRRTPAWPWLSRSAPIRHVEDERADARHRFDAIVAPSLHRRHIHVDLIC